MMKGISTGLQSIFDSIKVAPDYIKRKYLFRDKYQAELSYWKKLFKRDGNSFDNSWYINLMLPMSGESSPSAFKNKVVADFGCGPQGSLTWIETASERIGVDVLADHYSTFFDLASHNMRYVACTETVIPLADNTADILFTLNAMDHTANFEQMSKECLRILKPGGLFAGEFNLNRKPTICEPEVLSEMRVHENIAQFLDITMYRLTKCGEKGQYFRWFFENADMESGTPEPCILWIRGNKKTGK